MVRAGFAQHHGHDRVLIGLAAGSVCGQGALDGQVADYIAAYDDEVAGDKVLAIQVTHHIADRGRGGFEECELLEGRGRGSPFRSTSEEQSASFSGYDLVNGFRRRT